MRCVRGHTQIYMEVSDITSLWEHVKTFKDRYKIRDLFDSGCLVFSGNRHASENKFRGPQLIR